MCRGTLAKARRARRGMAGVRAESSAQFSKNRGLSPIIQTIIAVLALVIALQANVLARMSKADSDRRPKGS